MAEAAAPAGGRVVAPDGTVSYDFDGHISAKGLDLPAANLPVSTPETVPAVSGISWVPLDGGFVARVWADTRGLDLYADGAITARTTGSARMLLDNDGASDYAFAGDVAAELAARADDDLGNVSGWLLGPLDVAYDGAPDTGGTGLTANQTATWLTGGTWTAPPGVGDARFVFVGLVNASGPGGGWVRILYRDVTVSGPYNTVDDFYNDCVSGEYALALAAGSFGFPANGHDYEVTAQYVRSNNSGGVWTKNAALAVFRS